MMNRCYHSCLSAAEITTQHVHILPAAARVTSTSVSEDNGNIFFQMNLWWKQIVGGIDMDIIDAACWCSQWLLPWLHRWNQIYPAHLIELFNNKKTGGIVVCSGVGSRNNNGIRGFRGSLTFYLVWQPCNPWKCLPCSGCDPSWPFVVAVAIVLSIKSLRPACTVLLPSKLNMKLVLVSKRLWHNSSTPPPPPPPAPPPPSPSSPLALTNPPLKNKCSDRSMEVKIPALLANHYRQINQTTDRPTDRRARRQGRFHY